MDNDMVSRTIQGKTALVTGASRGIGKAIAMTLASRGCDLILTCRHSQKELEDTRQEILRSFPVSCSAFVCDAGSPDAVRDLFKKISDLDILINNAGISHIGLLQDMTDSEWENLLSSNLSSVFFNCRAAIPFFLKKKSGCIINISSVWGIHGGAMETAYSASKGGVNTLTRALARELAPSGITVNAIACGFIDTDMNSCFNEEDRQELKNEIPADRFGTAGDVARTVLSILYSSSYMTGQIITLDGGWT